MGSNIIRKPNKFSETDVLCELASEIKALPFDIQLFCEIKVERHQKRGCRFDMVIFKHKNPIIIIEVKRSRTANISSNQIKRYSSFGIPVILCRGMKGIEECMDRIWAILLKIFK